MNSTDFTYDLLLQHILDTGYETEPAERQAIGTKQIDSYTIKFWLNEEFPLLTTKKMFTKGIIHELLWFLKGDTNIKYLVDNGINIWNKDAYNYYLKLHKKITSWDGSLSIESFISHIKRGELDRTSLCDPKYKINYKLGDLGPVYGHQWRNFGYIPSELDSVNNPIPSYLGVDQISNLIRDIKHAITTGYNNRRLIVNAWNPVDVPSMALPPCHKDFQIILEPIHYKDRLLWWDKNRGIQNGVSQFSQNEKDITEDLDNMGVPKYYLNLIWNQRSVDTFLGLPFNIASYAFLAHMIAQQTNTIPQRLTGELRCVHIYNSHIDQVKEQLKRESLSSPQLKLVGKPDSIFDYTIDNFIIEDYISHPALQADMVD